MPRMRRKPTGQTRDYFRGLLEPGFGGGDRQTVDYIKVCSPDPKELNEWAVANLGYGLRNLRCQHCEPTSLGLTD